MAPKHLRGFPRNRLNFDTDFLTFPGAVYNFVVAFYAGDDAQLNELQQPKTVNNIYGHKNGIITSFVGTQIGVPSLTIPASIITPTTIGSRELKINCGRTRNLHGNTATCLNSSRFLRRSSSLYSMNLSNKW